MADVGSKGVMEAVASIKDANTFITALRDPRNVEILKVMKDRKGGKMTDEALAKGETILGAAQAATSDAAAGKVEVPVLTTAVLKGMGSCHKIMQEIATHVRGYARENEEKLDPDHVKTLVSSFNALIDGSEGQAHLPVRLMNLVTTARQKPEESEMAVLIAKAGVDADDLAEAEKAASAALLADAQQEQQKGRKVTGVSTKDQVVGDLEAWYSRWSHVARRFLTPEQQKILGLSPRAQAGRRPKKPAAPALPVAEVKA